jgi:hypothetical protein
MANTRFGVHESVQRSDCSFTDSGWFYKMNMKKGTFAKFYLLEGDSLTGLSNNPVVVPNSDAAFLGKTGSGPKRVIEIYGLTKGITLVGFYAAGSTTPVVTMQIEVVDLSGSRPSFVAFGADTAFAVNAPDIPAGFRYDFGPTKTRIVPGGPPENLFDPVPNGTKHVAINCHGQMSTGSGLTLFIAGNLSRSNCNDVFGKLKAKAAGAVIWVGGCEAGADNDFCKAVVQASGCYLVAPAITLQMVRVPANQIDFFGASMPKFFNVTDGTPMKADDFLQKQRDLNFRIVPG